ncbi:GNAT family N-acetyltransferase [Streptomyces sp. NPDC049040]|uniref:GNAT family N-acetyltransferase n=1 Tax=Streptomyces sp. NPDC049040 TaxID=3365593 RepID=UPI0037149184
MTDDDTSLLAAYDTQLRGVPPVRAAGTRYEEDGPLVRIVGQFRGFVSAPRDVGLRGAELDALIIRQREYFAARGEAVEWKIRGHDLPAELPQRLRAAGFVAEDRETVLVGRADELAEPAAGRALADGVTIRQTAAAEDLRGVGAMLTEVWGTDMHWLGADLAGRIEAAPDQIAVLVAESGGEIVSAAWLVHRPGTQFAGLWGGSTLAAHRGRGIYHALVAARARLAADRGVRYLQVDASDDSAPILRRLGFRAITTTTPYIWTPADTP